MLEGKVSENTYLWEHPEKGMIYVRCGGSAYKMESKVQVLGGYHSDVTERVLAEDVLTISGMRASESGITLNYPADEELDYPYVYGSPVHLRQLFLNIYSNAVKYNKMGGSIYTEFHFIEKKGNMVTYRWSISDTGIGMNQKFLEHIFEPFAQEHSDARSIYKGIGLGMSIVKSLINLMEGTIEVESKLGEGTKTVITLPFKIADEKQIAESREHLLEEKEEHLRGKRILLAEDNDLNAEIAMTILKEFGLEVDRAEDGEICVRMLQQKPEGYYDLILMDIQMPNMNGYQATESIRGMRDKRAEIPVVAMTANAFEEDRKRSLDAGMDEHIAKPIDIINCSEHWKKF